MEIRPYVAADEAAVRALVARRSRGDGRDALSEHKAMRIGDDEVREVVGTDQSHLIGYGVAAHHAAAEGHWAIEVVIDPREAAPAQRTVELVQALRRRLRTDETVTVWGWRDQDRHAAERAGWRRVRTLLEMIVELPVDSLRPMPEGIVLSAFEPGTDEDPWLVANALAFSRHPEKGSVDRANLYRRMAQPWFDPAGFLLAWQGDTLMGFCWTKLHPDAVGEIYIIGVIPAAAGKGLGSALLHAGLDDLAGRQGAQVGMLYVDAADKTALGMYHSIGFSERLELHEYVVSPGRAT